MTLFIFRGVGVEGVNKFLGKVVTWGRKGQNVVKNVMTFLMDGP